MAVEFGSALRRQHGVTLLELLIVVAIIGVLGSISYTGYTQYMVDARRSQAIATLTEMASLQEKYHLDNGRYAHSEQELGVADRVAANRHYEFEVRTTDPTVRQTFWVRATPKADSPQASDSACNDMRIWHSGLQEPAECFD